MKKGLIILTILGALLVCAAAAAFFFLKKPAAKENIRMNALHAVPVDALFFCYLDRLDILNETLTNDGSNWKAFTDTLSPMLSLLRHMEMSATNNKTATEILRSETVVSAHIQGKNEITYLWIITLPSSLSNDDWMNFLKTTSSSSQTSDYQHHKIVTIGSDEQALYCASFKGFALCSRSLILLQSTLRQLETGVSITDEEQFAAVMGTVANSVDMRFFLNHRMIQKIWPLIGTGALRKHGTFLSNTANWTALDGQVLPNMMHLSGFIFPSFSDDNYLSLLLSQQGANIAAWDFLPANTSMMLSMGIKDINRFFTTYRHYLELRKQLPEYQRTLMAMEELWQRKAEDLMAELYPQELVVAQLPNIGWITALRSGNAKYAIEQLNELAEKTGMKDFKKSGVIYHNPAEGILSALWGTAYGVTGDTYFTVHNDWFVFSDSLQLLNNFVPQQNNLKTRMQEMQASQYITNNASLVLCMQSSKNNDAFLSLLHPELKKIVARGLESNPPGMACLQMRPMQDKLYANFYAFFSEDMNPVKSKEKKENQPKALDTAKHETLQRPLPAAEEKPAAQPPATANERLIFHKFDVKNHYTKEKESLVQYTDHSIALLNAKGGTLWEKKLNAMIIDTVIQMDFFKNGKLQMLFTTGNQLYLLDRNGHTVAPFPLGMQPKVVCGVAVFDYAKDLEYRIFLAYADNTVRAYDKKGRVVSGFKTFTTKSKPVRAPEFVRAGGRDYIIVFDEQHIYILDRQGNVRTEVASPVAVKAHTPVIVQQSPPTIEVVTTKGKKMKIDLRDGKVK